MYALVWEVIGLCILVHSIYLEGLVSFMMDFTRLRGREEFLIAWGSG